VSSHESNLLDSVKKAPQAPPHFLTPPTLLQVKQAKREKRDKKDVLRIFVVSRLRHAETMALSKEQKRRRNEAQRLYRKRPAVNAKLKDYRSQPAVKAKNKAAWIKRKQNFSVEENEKYLAAQRLRQRSDKQKSQRSDRQKKKLQEASIGKTSNSLSQKRSIVEKEDVAAAADIVEEGRNENNLITEKGRPGLEDVEHELKNTEVVGEDNHAGFELRNLMSGRSHDDDDDDALPAWIHLTEGKQFSRLLYTNPVCFLCTTFSPDVSVKNRECTPPPLVTPAQSVSLSSPSATSSNYNNHEEASSPSNNKNVMVVSWLTCTNNSGGFMMSLNRNRHSAINLALDDNIHHHHPVEFTLCVPVQGMEDLVRNVGSVSGKWGSKFPADYDDNDATKTTTTAILSEGEPTVKRSKRQQKKKPRFVQGIPGLTAVALGRSDVSDVVAEENNDKLFAIQGTVAHLHCRTVVNNMEPATLIDSEHYLVLGQVVDAYVHSSYWDSTKNIFRPQEARPYLTFFGSQTFGYVVAQATS
jgi:hypothetical protein